MDSGAIANLCGSPGSLDPEKRILISTTGPQRGSSATEVKLSRTTGGAKERAGLTERYPWAQIHRSLLDENRRGNDAFEGP